MLDADEAYFKVYFLLLSFLYSLPLLYYLLFIMFSHFRFLYVLIRYSIGPRRASFLLSHDRSLWGAQGPEHCYHQEILATCCPHEAMARDGGAKTRERWGDLKMREKRANNNNYLIRLELLEERKTELTTQELTTKSSTPNQLTSGMCTVSYPLCLPISPLLLPLEMFTESMLPVVFTSTLSSLANTKTLSVNKSRLRARSLFSW